MIPKDWTEPWEGITSLEAPSCTRAWTGSLITGLLSGPPSALPSYPDTTTTTMWNMATDGKCDCLALVQFNVGILFVLCS